MKEVFQNQPKLVYAVAIVSLLTLAIVSPPENLPEKGTLAVMVMMSALTLCSILHVGWVRRVEYPFPNHRRKALILWAYATPITALITVISLQDPGPPWVGPVVYVLSFFLLTTMTFGILPRYGGAYSEYWELERRRGRVGASSGIIVEARVHRDNTIESVSEVCRTCLTAVLPDDEKCWRCGSIVRWQTRFRKEWINNRQSRWEKREREGQVFWVRTWRPEYVHVDEQGHMDSRLRVDSVYAYVFLDGSWAISAFASTLKDKSPHLVLLDRERERTPRAARRKVDEVIWDIDMQRIIEDC